MALLKKATEKIADSSDQMRFTTNLRRVSIGARYMSNGIVEGMVQHEKKTDGTEYEIWQGENKKSALEFLRKIPCSEIPPLFYIIVETPEGSFGKDIDGMFIEDTGESID